jgi:hypothetical protein
MPCVFCGATDHKMSNEHLWPQWVRRLLPTDTQKEAVTYNLDTEAGRQRSFSTTLFELKVKDVCKPCNEGWMSQYETNVQRWITGMLQGRGRELHSTGQTAIAAWAVLKCLVGQCTFRDRGMIPEQHYRAVYGARAAAQPPEGPQVFTARAGWSQGAAPLGFFRVNGLSLRPDKGAGAELLDGYLATLSVLDLVVQVFWPYDPGAGVYLHQHSLAGSIQQIWPVSTSFVWPPGPPLTGAGISGISGPEPR